MSSIDAYINKKAQDDTAVYWGTPVVGADTSITYAAPVEINCVWTEVVKNIRDDDGREFVSQASVWVLQDMEDRSMLFHGALTDLTAGEQADPREINNAYEVKKYIKKPSLRIKGEFERIAML